MIIMAARFPQIPRRHQAVAGLRAPSRRRLGWPILISTETRDGPMGNLTAAVCLAVALLIGGAGMCSGADFQKGLEAAQSGD